MKRVIVSGVALFLTLWVTPSHADNCASIIQRTEVYTSSSTNLQIALLSMIDKSDYDEAKRDIGTSALTEVGIFSGSYDDFEQKLSTYKSTLNYTYNDQETRSFATSYLPSGVSSAWVACEELKSQSDLGFHAMIHSADSYAVVVYYSWNQPTSPAKLDSFSVTGVKAGWQHLPATWPSGTHFTATYERSSPTTPFYLDASVGHIGQHLEVPGAPLPEPKPISLGCGDFQSNAIAAAVEAGQRAGRSEDTAWRSIPFSQVSIATNSNRAGAAVYLNSRCDATSTTPTGASERVVLKSSASIDLPHNDGADRHGWARWSPSWKGKISLPYNAAGSSYFVKVSYSDSNTNSVPLSACKVQFAGKNDSLPNNGAGEISNTLGSGDYLLAVDCSRPEVLTFDETITIDIAARSGVPVNASATNK